MTLNTAVLDRALLQITTFPASWDQDAWIAASEQDNSCGTTMCLAGHLMVASGEFRQVGLVISEDGWDSREALPGEKVDEYAFARVGEKFDEDGYIDEAGEAARILGVNEDEADHLFYGTVDMTFPGPESFALYVREYVGVSALVPA